MSKKLKYFLDINALLLMSHLKILKQPNASNHMPDISPPELKKTRNSRARKSDVDCQNVDISNEPPCSEIKKTRKPRAPRLIPDNSSLDVDIKEPQSLSNKRKRGRPPKFKNEITKSHWLGFFAFVSEHSYFDVAK